MKKFLSLLLLTLTLSFVLPTVFHSNDARSQIVTTLVPTAVNDTLTNADTAWVYVSTGLGATTTAIADNASRSVECLLTKLSGTAAGSVTLEGTIDGTNWVSLNSDTFTNIASNVKVYSLRNSAGDMQYKQYRVVFITSGTVSAIPKVYYLRRSN